MSEPPNGDDLPTYDALAASEANVPNSRFGRWREWVEKRANERDVGSSPEQKLKRRIKGWGETSEHRPSAQDDLDAPGESSRTSEDRMNYSETLPSSIPYTEYEDVPLKRLSSGERIQQSHASIHHFGSRFIPHSDSPIHTVLPLMSDRYLLLGTDDGLSVLDLLPGLHGGAAQNSGGGHLMTLGDAKPRKLWIGESIHQLALLEIAQSDARDENSLKGVVLALVGVDVGEERRRTVRMYSLSSLCSLISFAVNQPESAKPLNLNVSATLQTTPKKSHKTSKSITKGLRSLVISEHSASQSPAQKSRTPPDSASTLAPSEPDFSPTTRVNTDDSWDIIDELPMRWATDYIPLAPASGRTPAMDVTRFELYHQSDGSLGGGGVLLALASKSTILIFEAPRGERAFRLLKDLYTPFPVTHLQFVEQAAPKNLHARHSEKSPQPRSHSDSRRSLRTSLQFTHHSSSRDPIYVGSASQLALFVSFEKRAALIRLSDTAVQEVQLYEDPNAVTAAHRTISGEGRARSNSKGFSHTMPGGVWLPVIPLRLPPSPPIFARDDREVLALQTIYVLTKGKQTHLVRSPIPSPLSSVPPLIDLKWEHAPTSISARIIPDPKLPDITWEGLVQLVGFGPAGIEVLEIPVSRIRARASSSKGGQTHGEPESGVDLLPSGSLISQASSGPEPSHAARTSSDLGATLLNGGGAFTSLAINEMHHDPSPPATATATSLKGKGKSKTLPMAPVEDAEFTRGYVDIGSDTVFLARGGRWHEMLENGHPASRSLPRLARDDIDSPFDEGEENSRERDREKDPFGVYACAYHGPGDFKVFYVGDFATGDSEMEND